MKQRTIRWVLSGEIAGYALRTVSQAEKWEMATARDNPTMKEVVDLKQRGFSTKKRISLVQRFVNDRSWAECVRGRAGQGPRVLRLWKGAFFGYSLCSQPRVINDRSYPALAGPSRGGHAKER